jgi:hypothetical protein
MISDRRLWNRSSGIVSPELSDAISPQPFDNFLVAIKAFPNACQDSRVWHCPYRLPVGLEEQLGCGIGRPPVPAVEGVLLGQANQEACSLLIDVAVERPDPLDNRVEPPPVGETMRISPPHPDVLQDPPIDLDELFFAQVLDFSQGRDPNPYVPVLSYVRSQFPGQKSQG